MSRAFALIGAVALMVPVISYAQTSCETTQKPAVSTSVQGWLNKLPVDVGRPNPTQFADMVDKIVGIVCQNGLDATKLSPEELINASSEAMSHGGTIEQTPGVTFSFSGPQVAATPRGDLSKGTQPANCFDYYRFGSIEPRLSTAATSVTSGGVVHVTGTLQNDNPYPIVDGVLYVKVFHGASSTKDPAGPDLVDEYVALNNLILPAGSSTPIAFDWHVPHDAASGTYRIGTFLSVSSRYNLLGLPFTDDVIGSGVSFKVVGRAGGVSFDRHKVTLNDSAYTFAAFPPHFKTEPVVVNADLANDTDASETVRVTWKLYKWDQQREENYLTTQVDSVTVAAHSRKTVSFTARDTQNPVYELVVDARSGESDSILNIRFVRDGVEGARINFPGISTFPLQQGKSATLFSCLHSMNAPLTNDSTLDLKLSDDAGTTIASATYHGSVSGDMMGIADKFIPTRDYKKVFLHAKLSRGGSLVEDETLTYDCADLDPVSCGAPAAVRGGELLRSDGTGTSAPVRKGALPTVIILSSLLLAALYLRFKEGAL